MVYVHVPFCGSFCTYCGFYSEILSSHPGSIEAFCSAIEAEASARKGEIISSVSPDTLYIGGGTPSVLPPVLLSRIKDAVGAARSSGPGAEDRPHYVEFTVEVNPEDIVEKGSAYVQALLDMGVNRISMGVQSLDDNVLKWMNRRHDAAGARKAYRILREAGAGNVSIDLISGISFLPDDVWKSTLLEVTGGFGTGIPPEHISAYQLSVDPESALSSDVASGRYEEASDRQCEMQYRILCGILADAGYRHYEISNFALPGREAVHNSGYWSHEPYVGLGPAAHSFSAGDRLRRWNTPSLKEYLAASSAMDGTDVQTAAFPGGSEHLSDAQMALETIMLSLRTDRGIDEGYLRRHSSPGEVDKALSSGMLCRIPGGLRIPEEHFFISDSIIAALV